MEKRGMAIASCFGGAELCERKLGYERLREEKESLKLSIKLGRRNPSFGATWRVKLQVGEGGQTLIPLKRFRNAYEEMMVCFAQNLSLLNNGSVYLFFKVY